MLFLGIDPGVSGGVAYVDECGVCLMACKMPETPADVLALLRAAPPGGVTDIALGQRRACLERVHSMPDQGHVGAFTFGRGYGHLEAFLIALGIPYDNPTPQTWQKVMECRSGGDKNVTKRRAQQLFPLWRHPITHAIADALLIAEYCRRVHTGAVTYGEAIQTPQEEGPRPKSQRQQAISKRVERLREGQGQRRPAGTQAQGI